MLIKFLDKYQNAIFVVSFAVAFLGLAGILETTLTVASAIVILVGLGGMLITGFFVAPGQEDTH